MPRLPRVPVGGEPPAVGDEVPLGDSDAHHLRRVLRLGPGDAVELVDGAGGVWRAELVGPDAVRARVEGFGGSGEAPAARLEVWVPLLKGGRTDDLVRQLTELGASALIVHVCARSVARLEGAKRAKRVARWHAIAVEATKQCGRTDRPTIRFASLAEAEPFEGAAVVLWEGAPGAGPGLGVQLRGLEAATRGAARVVVGPEGGFEAAEVARLKAAGHRIATLGRRVLRAETAVLVAAALAAEVLGELGTAPEDVPSGPPPAARSGGRQASADEVPSGR